MSKKASALYKGMPLKLADIVVGDTLGTGTFSRVRIARHKASGKYMALKILKKAEIIRLKQVDHIMSEKSILQAINHPMISLCTARARMTSTSTCTWSS